MSTAKEKFVNVLEGIPGATPPDWEYAYWYDAIKRWYEEGLPYKKALTRFPNAQFVPAEALPMPDNLYEESIYPADLNDYFNFDERMHAVGVLLSPIPGFESEIIKETPDKVTMRCSDGKVMEILKDGSSMPHYLEYPVKTEKDFYAYIEHFDPNSPERFADWDAKVKRYKNRTFPLQLGGGAYSGFFSSVRELLGVERSLMEFYENPDLCRKILSFYLNYLTDIYTKVLADVEVDFILFWEDLSFKTGPLVSPDIFKEFIAPCYKTFIDRMKEMGVRHFIVDTDGDFLVLVDLFLESGVTGFYPYEVAAGMDIAIFREKYPHVVMMGGIDKRALAHSKKAIDAELIKVKKVLKTGGYLPFADHMVPPEVSWENFTYYRNQLKSLYA